MKTDRIKLYVIDLLLVLVMAFLALFESNGVTKIFLAIVLAIFAVIISRVLKKRLIISTSERQVFLLMLFFAIIYLALFYMLGFYFGLNRATVRFGVNAITRFILPITVIIISSEYIRYILIAQKGKLNSFFVLISMVFVDIIVYTQLYDLREYNDFLAVVGFVSFASISCNLLYNYLSKRYGYKPIIAYRLLTVLYCYIIPYVPNLSIFMRSVFRMIFPYIVYLVIDNTYSTVNKANTLKEKRKNTISTFILFFVAGVITYLISCQFTFGMFVIGSGSMTGTINKGDAVVFQKLGDQDIKERDVIVFKKKNVTIVHRVINIQIINGEERYFTKGDANDVEDDKYVTRKDIVGKSLFRIRYIGYPTLWLRSLFV